MITPSARQIRAAVRLFVNFKASIMPRRVEITKLTAMATTNSLKPGLLGSCPFLNLTPVWSAERNPKADERIPSVCQMPEAAKNKSIGAKMQPRYRWMDRSFCIACDGSRRSGL